MEADRLLTPLYGLGVAGAFLQVAGANWDVSSHILGIVDSFFTPSHLVLYLGIFLVLLAGFLGVWFERQTGAKLRPFFTGFRVAFVGSLIQLVAGPLDLWWHSVYGFDPYLFTPTHSMLIVGLALGGVGMGVGTLRLLQRNNNDGTRLLKFLGALILGTLWLDVNFVVLWLANAQGVAYTFGVCAPQVISARSCAFVGAYEGAIYLPALFLDALGGAAVILLAARTMGRRGALTSVAALVVSVNATANLGFTAYMLLYVGVPGSFYFAAATRTAGAEIASIIPPYLALLIPVLLLDLLARREGRRALVASLVAGPLSVFIDGRFSLFSGLWSPDVTTLLYLLPMILGGLAARGIKGRLEEALLSGRVPTALGGLPEQA
ncbi:MAG: hypothetical protein E6K84_00910 [Thaumarchaeota archaeon]|nr:MAG: hypothetical protein E6K84_00910 [Nitrososphaerota archaeon]